MSTSRTPVQARGPLAAIRARLGQGTVEFALLSLVFIPTAIGAIEIARGVWYYNQVSQLAREGARYVIVTGTELRTDYYLGDPNNIGNTEGSYSLASCGCGADTTVGWMARKDVGLDRNRTTVTIDYTPDIPLPPNPPPPHVRGYQVSVKVEFGFEPILATFLGIPASIPMSSTSTMHMQ